mmetsp:Transcript_55771/g.120525  ORF Transcript_55771/g.120525 Transcript_55771/m.120525 type:complete len:469 (-) Transcript_55771:116-1522(-)|eukprot:CAMPEP_0170599222 /NCGR_PEP_ID=MMETSP0224-20130122/16677_1 /TAXON_ID=285029 /ORGANISM="Togula jolla, Strain CCCM 725" /LENGTH=468 /DNA_ID=CAMNT_0010923849 /DNA_START=70 /DNA_END=1476 /DNA_ORIENTATION=-
MAMLQRTSRPRLLPVAIALSAACFLLNGIVSFVPPPGSRSDSVRQSVDGDASAAAVTAVALTALTASALPAVAAVDSPLAHGAPGVIDSDVIEGLLEKCAFGGLLSSTVFAWWRGTVGGAAQKKEDGQPASFWALSFACLSLVALLSDRWYSSGHFPLSNMYESLMFLAWGVTAVTLFYAVSEKQESSSPLSGPEPKTATSSDIAAIWASPTALGVVAFATLSLPKELQKASALVPALQSNWLVMHVSVVMLAYATLIFGSVLCMATLALAQPKDSPITAMREAVVPALRGIANSLVPAEPELATSPQMPNANAMSSQDEEAVVPPVQNSRMQVASGEGSVTVEFSQSSSGGGGSVVLTEDDRLSFTIDDLAYRSILLGFGFLTVGIISGAVWANEAWGNYWSWDPKETWALIAWLVYAVYLHTRLQLGWDTRDSAKVGAFGFFVVWLCYIGVNLMGVGLHSYGFFLK